MTIEYEQGEPEILALQQHLLARSPSVQKLIQKQRYGYSLIFIALGLVLGALNQPQRISVWLGALACALLWITYYPRLVVSTLKSGSRKLVKQAKEQGLFGRQVLTVERRGLSLRNQQTETSYPWQSVAEIAESDQHLFLHLGPTKAYAVPKAAFPDRAAVQQFLETCNGYRS